MTTEITTDETVFETNLENSLENNAENNLEDNTQDELSPENTIQEDQVETKIEPLIKKDAVLDKGRSRKYKANAQKIREFLVANPKPNLAEALDLLGTLDQPKYKNGPSIELHINANIDATKSDQLVRGSVSLPHGSGKEVRIAAFVNPENVELAKKAGATIAGSEELIDEIKNSQKIDFDKAIAQADMMKKLPPIARLLGTAGVMPNPKTGTVGDNVEEMIKEILAGKVDYRNDKTGNLHILCGRFNKNFTTAQLLENIQAAYDSVVKAKPEGVKKKYLVATYIATSQSPSVPVFFN